MINKTKIRAWSGSSSYEKGLNLYYASKVMDFQLDQDEEYDYVSANVKGSGRKTYQVGVEVETATDDIDRITCQCPAFSSYSGICKHCAAVLLEYIDHRNQRKEEARQMELQLGDMETLAGMRGMSGMSGNPRTQAVNSTRKPAQKKTIIEPPAEKTTEVIRQLLQKQMISKTIPMVEQETFGKVRLEPYLTYNSNGFSVELKIGVTKMYVLKDIYTMVQAVKHQGEYEYGKNLKFIHSVEAFAPEYQNLVKFLINWSVVHPSYYSSGPYSYSNYYSSSKLRNVPLKNNEMEDFLDSMGNQEFLGKLGRKAERKWHVEKDIPLVRKLQITGETDGIRLKLDVLDGFVCTRNYVYFVDGSIYMEDAENLRPIADFLTSMARIPDRTAYIEKADVPMFCRELLPVLEQYYKCKKKNFEEELYGVVSVSFEIYLDLPQEELITCQVLVVYGEKKFWVYGDKRDLEHRDMAAEIVTGQKVSSYCNVYDEKNQCMVIAEDEEMMYDFLTSGIQELQKLGEVFISDRLKRMEVRQSPKVAVGVSISGNLLELHMTSDDMSMEELLDILSRYNRKKRFFRLKNGDFMQTENGGIEALMDLKQGLGLSDAQMKKDQIQLPRYRALYLDTELKEHQELPAVKDRAFKSLVRNMKTVDDNDFEIPQKLEKILREYQKRGFLWIKTMKHNGFGGILADDMGLGKTLQVICFLMSEFQEMQPGEERQALIVSPASLVYNWKSELERFAPELPAVMVVGSAAERKALIEQKNGSRILLTSYDLLKRDIELYENQHYDYQIIDEAQYIKNHATQAARAVKTVDAGFKLALTGTPVENRLSELWSIFDYLMPGFLYPYKRFREELETPIVQNQDEETMKRLQKMIRPFVLRRLKKDVLADLPDKLEENVFVKLEAEQISFYTLTGATTKEKRAKLVEAFNQDDTSVFCISLKAGGTGLNLTAADIVIHYDPWWNVAVQNQATDRAHRIGQEHVVNVYKLVARDTIEENIIRLQDKKRELADQVLSGEGMSGGSFSKEEILELLQ